MIRVKKLYIGNETECYIQGNFTDGLNIISSEDNHVGKTIVMQGIMFTLGADPKFPPSLKYKQYLFIVDIDIDRHELSILRSKDYFIVKDGDTITPLERKNLFDQYWSENVFLLPTIIKNGAPTLAGLSLYTQMAFVPQTDPTPLEATFVRTILRRWSSRLWGLMPDRWIPRQRKSSSVAKKSSKRGSTNSQNRRRHYERLAARLR